VRGFCSVSRVAKVKFVEYAASIFRALDLIGAPGLLPKDGLIVIKPNLTNTSPPPVTTPIQAAMAVHAYCSLYSKAKVSIGEGSGSGSTADAFDALGYTRFAESVGVDLLDFNREKTVIVCRSGVFHLKEFHIPEVVRDAFVISLPVLKDHTFTVTTISMKNMFGIAPAPFYGGSWNKSRLHTPSTHRSVVDVNLYKKPDLCVVDAAVALSGSHLAGAPRPLGFILAGADPVAVDAVGSELLGHDPRTIEYLVRANGLLGSFDGIEIVS
jgi:uncharacterized protein (DUF362 family)